jgi:DNA polymerase IV (archaeal DinB-like DNA polymerase)
MPKIILHPDMDAFFSTCEEKGLQIINRIGKNFFKDVNNFNIIDEIVDKISERIIEELKEKNYLYRTISIKIRIHDFKTFTRANTLHYLRYDKETLANIAKELSREFYGDKIRLIGVRVSNLEEFKYQKRIKEFLYA